MSVTYEEYDELCGKFREPYDGYGTYRLSDKERRLIWLALAASKAQLKEYDPKKGLNQ